MSAVPYHHTLSQGPVLLSLVKTALSTLEKKPAGGPARELPGPWLEATLPPRPPALIRDYVRNVGGDPAWYRGTVPAHLFPQWGFPLAARAIAGLPYPLTKVMNAGCRIEQRAPLPAGEALEVRARLIGVDDDGRRAILTTRIETGTKSAPRAVTAELRAYVPLSRGERSEGKKARPAVPAEAHELGLLRLSGDAGLSFATLTGDFNPIHWLAPYARAAGFRTPILHGFATLARAIETLNRARFSGDATRLTLIDARFVRPLPLPSRVGVYVTKPDGLWVGDAPGGGVYLEGRFSTEPQS